MKRGLRAGATPALPLFRKGTVMKFNPAFITEVSEDGLFQVTDTVDGVYAEVYDPDNNDWVSVDEDVFAYATANDAKQACIAYLASLSEGQRRYLTTYSEGEHEDGN